MAEHKKLFGFRMYAKIFRLERDRDNDGKKTSRMPHGESEVCMLTTRSQGWWNINFATLGDVLSSCTNNSISY